MKKEYYVELIWNYQTIQTDYDGYLEIRTGKGGPCIRCYGKTGIEIFVPRQNIKLTYAVEIPADNQVFVMDDEGNWVNAYQQNNCECEEEQAE